MGDGLEVQSQARDCPSPQDTGLQPVSPVLSWRLGGPSWCKRPQLWQVAGSVRSDGNRTSCTAPVRGLPVEARWRPPRPCHSQPSDRPVLVSHQRGTRTPRQGPEGQSPWVPGRQAQEAADILKMWRGFHILSSTWEPRSLQEAATEAAGDRAVWGSGPACRPSRGSSGGGVHSGLWPRGGPHPTRTSMGRVGLQTDGQTDRTRGLKALHGPASLRNQWRALRSLLPQHSGAKAGGGEQVQEMRGAETRPRRGCPGSGAGPSQLGHHEPQP